MLPTVKTLVYIPGQSLIHIDHSRRVSYTMHFLNFIQILDFLLDFKTHKYNKREIKLYLEQPPHDLSFLSSSVNKVYEYRSEK